MHKRNTISCFTLVLFSRASEKLWWSNFSKIYLQKQNCSLFIIDVLWCGSSNWFILSGLLNNDEISATNFQILSYGGGGRLWRPDWSESSTQYEHLSWRCILTSATSYYCVALEVLLLGWVERIGWSYGVSCRYSVIQPLVH